MAALNTSIGTFWDTSYGRRRVSAKHNGAVFYIFGGGLDHGAVKGAELAALEPLQLHRLRDDFDRTQVARAWRDSGGVVGIEVPITAQLKRRRFTETRTAV